MAGVSKIEELAARKQALVAESELCRQELKTELQHFRGHVESFYHKFDRVRSVGPWLMLAGPVAVPLLRMVFSKKSKQAPQSIKGKGALATAMLAFRLYRKYAPMVKSVMSHLRSRKSSAAQTHSRATLF
ncbi:MAG TPA: hypothetical protein VKY92_08280 [Verrucomicrobiae bacterium]|nr:hypothetical protein [Verrucomicrobiae bacterium]